MQAGGFIARRLRVKEKMAVVAIAISFFVIIIAVAISAGFRREIRGGVSAVTGDILLTGPSADLTGGADPVRTPARLQELAGVRGVERIEPVIYSAGILKIGDDIQGALFKGTAADTVSMGVRIPSTLATRFGLQAGDDLTAWFVGEKTKVRKWHVLSVYESPMATEAGQLLYVPIGDLRRLHEWAEDESSLLEVAVDPRFRDRAALAERTSELGWRATALAGADEDPLRAVAATERFPQLFDWLDLIDFNVYAILLLMTVVAGFNMISGLLILLFRHVSTIGTLKTLGMGDRAVAGVFLRVGARTAAIGMAAGNALALLFCLVQGTTHWIKLNPENYFVSFVPVHVDLPGILVADAAAFLGILLLLLIPTLFISRVDPARTVKAE
ncbi:FtsX-like permease family protein [Bacteroidales bacterium WCE2004]|nr:ABC transporter permease [Bacteroidales bacterium]SKC42920.1 FtsX-like permease family protein [Bacteroidales bacterium WCE2004]